MRKDKVYGKALTNESLQNALALFFYDGEDFRNDIIDIMLSKLRDLREVVKRVEEYKCRSYRATGASGHQVSYLPTKGEVG